MSDLHPGDVLRGKYEILNEIGRGGMGVVYRARHILLDEFQALKLLLDARPQFIKAFLAEAQLVRRLRHPFIVEVFDVDVAENGFPFVVMEYVEGPSLRELLDRGPLPPQRALEIAARVCDALAFAHRRGVIHRDIKPQNILVSADPTPGTGGGHVKVIDFGIAKVLAEADMQVTGMLTAPTGFALGTPEYSSPEQAMGLPSHELDPRSDLYSVGLVLYEMLSGTRPFSAPTPMGVLIARLQQPPRPITDTRPDLNSELVRLVMRSISSDRESRYQSGEEMAAALRALRATMIGDQDLAGEAAQMPPAPSAPAPPTVRTPATPLPAPAQTGSVEQTPARPRLSPPPGPEFPKFLDTAIYTPPQPPAPAPLAAPPLPGAGWTPPAPPPRRRGVLWVVLLLLLLVGIVGAGAWYLLPRFLGPAWQQARSLVAPSPAPSQPQPSPAPPQPAEQQPPSAPAPTPAAAPPATQTPPPAAQPAPRKPAASQPPPPAPATGPTPRSAAAAPGSVRLNARDGLNYVSIPSGEFMMGCSGGDAECLDAEQPAHGVRLTHGFWIGQNSVTVAAWKKFRSASGQPALAGKDNFGRLLNEGQGDDSFPATAMTWDQARQFCEWSGGRLPSEAEWEYAARAGSSSARYGSLDEIAWYGDNSGNSPVDTTALWASDRQHYAQRLYANGNGPHPVGQKKPNAWKLYDTLGNIWNWVADWYAGGYYQQGAAADPPGPSSGTLRLLRGGSWFFSAPSIRVSNRLKYAPNLRVFDFGCRCARDQAP